ncbi:MAG: cysteine desulfurase [Anaerolineae bacterium]|nr:cysteine desulfurase [Anaerolineae bacterium]
MGDQSSIYMDYASTAPTIPQVVDAMAPYWGLTFGNSDSQHRFGRDAADALEKARSSIADLLNCHPVELVFTGSGTESDNLALRGTAWAARQNGTGNHIVTTTIEHRAVEATVEQLREIFHFDVTRVPVDEFGQVSAKDIARAIRPDTIVVSVITANNEVGTVQPVFQIGQVCHQRGVLFHTDAVQAAGKLPIEVEDCNIDLLAISAHKIYGPKGVGLLYIRRRTPFVPPITGGHQERGRYPGTVNVAGAVGLATAFEIAETIRKDECKRLSTLRNQLIENVLSAVPESRLTGHPRQRLCNIASFAFKGVEGEDLVVRLDQAGISASTGAACSSGEPEASAVLEAMGIPPEWGTGSLRLSLGRSTSGDDVARVVDILPGIVAQLRIHG